LVERFVDALPFGEQLFEDDFAVGREAVETLVAPVLLAPFADQEALGLEAAEQRVERAFVDGEAETGERLAQGVAVLLVFELGKHGHDEAAAAELEAKLLEEAVVALSAVCHIACGIHYTTHSILSTVILIFWSW